VIAVAGWVREANKEPRIVEAPQQVEVVEVLVAARDLTTGTAFTKTSVDELTRFAHVPKSTVPPDAKLIKTKDELIGKRLSRKTHAGESFNVADVNTKTAGFEIPKDIISLPYPANMNLAGGSRIDLVAIFRDGMARKTFTLIPDLNVLAVNGVADFVFGKEVFGKETELAMASFEVNDQQGKLIELANRLQCDLELRPRSDYDYAKTLALLQSLQKKQEEPKLEVAPPPRAKSVS